MISTIFVFNCQVLAPYHALDFIEFFWQDCCILNDFFYGNIWIKMKLVKNKCIYHSDIWGIFVDVEWALYDYTFNSSRCIGKLVYIILANVHVWVMNIHLFCHKFYCILSQ